MNIGFEYTYGDTVVIIYSPDKNLTIINNFLFNKGNETKNYF